jgi:Tfp pilus assembly protein PilE
MKKLKGFTVVEAIVVCIVIGLLVAMAVPAYQKVRDASILKSMEAGNTKHFSAKDFARYKELMALKELALQTHKNRQTQTTPPKDPTTQIMIVEGKSYHLIPKINYQEIKIGDVHYVLIPALEAK